MNKLAGGRREAYETARSVPGRDSIAVGILHEVQRAVGVIVSGQTIRFSQQVTACPIGNELAAVASLGEVVARGATIRLESAECAAGFGNRNRTIERRGSRGLPRSRPTHSERTHRVAAGNRFGKHAAEAQ